MAEQLLTPVPRPLMNRRNLKPFSFTVLLLLGCVAFPCGEDAQKTTAEWKPEIPKTWVDDEMSVLEIPLSDPASSPKHIPAEYYYRIPMRPIYKSYPVYAPGKEPPGYIEQLSKQEPEMVFDASKLRTEQDWIKAGELVFDAPIATGTLFLATPGGLYLREPKWYEKTRAAIAKDGTLRFYRYVIAEKGKVEIGILSCAMSHRRVMPDGSIIKGAQGNFPFDRAFAYDYGAQADKIEDARTLERVLYSAPAREPKLETQLGKMSVEDIASVHEAIPPGVIARHRSSPSYPVQVPDLIGVKDRCYLDRSGLQVHRSLVDLMRYDALNQGGDDLARFGDFIPMGLLFDGKLPDPNTQTRYSDEQLYALALYLYSLKPPRNPNKFDAQAAR
jgi:hypothetical protein